METGNEFYDNLPDYRKEKYALLFEDKSSWYIIKGNGKKDWSNSKDKIDEFNNLLNNFKISQNNKDKYDFSFIRFPPFNSQDIFTDNIIDKDILFGNAVFHGEANFESAIFNNKAIFLEAIFFDNANFKKTVFNDDVGFWKVTFHKEISFRSMESKKIFGLSLAKFFKIDLANARINNNMASILKLNGLTDNKKFSLHKKHFDNRESARLIKNHFEKQNNIIEANIYFRIEQELYIEELKEKETKERNKKAILFTLKFNKWVSDFGTDWLRALFVLCIFSYSIAILYITAKNYDFFPKTDQDIICDFWSKQFNFMICMLSAFISLYYTTRQKYSRLKFWASLLIGIALMIIAYWINWGDNRMMTNYIVQLISPINAFKEKNLYEGIELYGMIVRVVALIIIYQIIVAFRQNTRRK